MSQPYLGELKLWAGTFPPVGYMYCSGQLLSIAEFDALYALLGTIYGGDGVTTFALPDFRGRVAVDNGRLAGGQTYVTGEMAGAESVTITTDTLPAHMHMAFATMSGSVASPANALLANAENGQPNGSMYGNGGTLVQLAPQTIGGGPGGNLAHENRQPYLGLRYIIAVYGVFPSRN